MKKVFTILMTATTLLIISATANAQGGDKPFVGSTHTYTVEMEDGANTASWIIADAIGVPLSTQPTFTANKTGKTATMVITWATADSYKLQFTEYNETTECATIKELDITVSANTFDVTVLTPAATCNSADGEVDFSGTTATTSVTFTVDMATDDTDFNPNWEFTFTLTPAGSASVANVKAGSTSLTAVSEVYTATGLTSTTGTGTVDISMDVTGGIYAVQSVVLAITSAKELTYNTPDVDSDDWSATQTINPIPETSTISFD